MLTKMSPQQKRILIVKWVGWPCGYQSAFLPQPPLSSPNRLMNKAAMVAGMEVIYGLGNTDEHLFTKADLTTATAECPICQKQRLTLSLQYGSIPRGDQSVTWWQVGSVGPLPSWKGQYLSLLE